MLDTLFLQIFDMTKIACIVILIVLVARLFLKRAPKVFSYALWAIVLFRLLCPVSIEAPISLIPETEPTIESYELLNEPITPIDALDAAQQAVGDMLNGGIGIQHVRTTEFDEDGTRRIISTDFANVWMLFGKYVWLVGIAVLLVYSGVSYGRLRSKLPASVKLHDNIYIADHIDSPFVMGLFRPKIYLPSALSVKERDYILLHERHHIRRGDHIVKLLSFAALCLHWFNPLVWAAFILSGKDMEMSCDEAVLRSLGADIRADYSASLISLATGRRIIAGTPLAFGEGNTEGRIKNIAKWKKPAIWVIVIAVIVCIAIAVCLITNPMSQDPLLWGAEYRLAEILYRIHDEIDWDAEAYEKACICITADYCMYWRGKDGEWALIGAMEPYTPDRDELSKYTALDDGWQRRYNIGEITDSYILRMDEHPSEHLFHLVLRTKNGDVLYGAGIEDISERGQGASDDTSLICLLRLESTFGGTHLSGAFHERSLAQTVGGDVEIFHTWTNADIPGYMIVGFMSDDLPYMDGIQIPSPEKTDMGFAVFHHNKDESGYRLIDCHVYEDAALAENGIFLCPDQAVLNLTDELKPKQTYDVILLNNDRIKKATRVWEYADGTTKTQSEPCANGRQMLLFSWENDMSGCRVWQYFYDEHGEIITQASRVAPVSMLPTAANVSGAFDAYLYVPIDSANYRYERIETNPDSLTKGTLIHQFTEEADPENVDWRVYSVVEYPDRSVVLAEAEDYVQLYRFSPSKAVDPALLEQAKKDGKIVVEDGYATSGQAVWNTFCKLSDQGEHISAEIVHYHTLEEPKQYSEQYYEVYKEDYPSMFTFDLTYNGRTYTLSWNEYGTPYVRTYKYLMRYEDTLPTYLSSKEPQKVTRYVLTNDNTVSWDDLTWGLASSQLGDYIDHFTIYSEIDE